MTLTIILTTWAIVATLLGALFAVAYGEERERVQTLKRIAKMQAARMVDLRRERDRARVNEATALHIAGKHRMHPAHVRINRANAQDAMTHGQGDAS